MEVSVKDTLPSSRAGVENHPIVPVQTFLLCHCGRRRDERRHDARIGLGGGRCIGLVFARDHQHVGGCLRFDVSENDGVVVLPDHRGRQVSRDDATKQAVIRHISQDRPAQTRWGSTVIA